MYGWLWIACSMMLGCYEPSATFEACTVTCGGDVGCPSGMRCVDGRCRGELDNCGVIPPSFGPWTATPIAELGSVQVVDPTLSSDLLVLYFGSGNPGFDIFRATRASLASPWGGVAPVTEINTAERENAPELVGNELYFTTNRLSGNLTRDVFRATRATASDPWSAPAVVSELSMDDESDVGIQPGGLRVIVGWRPTQPEQADLLEWTRASTSESWRRSRTLLELASPEDELNATYSQDGLTIFFSSNRTGTHELYVANRPSLDEPFGAPQAIDELDFPGTSEADPWISPDGTTLFFTSNNRLWQATRELQ